MKIKPHLEPMLKTLACVALVSALISAGISDQPTPYLLKYPANFGSRFTIPVDNPSTIEGVYLGRMLFYETRLSANNQLSCASCHQQEKAFTDGKKLSVGVDGNFTKRNAMSLANLLWVRRLFWDGRSTSLEEQAEFPLTDPHEMAQSLDASVQKLSSTPLYAPLFKSAFGDTLITKERILKALAQFERTLISANSPYDKYLDGELNPTLSEQRGMELFMEAPNPETGKRGANCGHCHGGPKTYKELFHNNGLDMISKDGGRQSITGDTLDHGRFRVPTLRNIALTAPYMHDGRFRTLEEVLDHYNEHIQESVHLSDFLRNNSNQKNGTKLALTATEKKDIVAFLHMLTDSSFIKNPLFSNPHKL